PQRRPSLIANQSDSTNSRTLASPPTLSLTLHLFLNLSSLVHSLIEQHKFLPAARLENLGRVVWRELEGFKPELEKGAGGEEQQKSVKEMFPIVVRHHEGMDQLGPLIVRRATAELRSSNLPPLVVAQTLASLVLLDHASLSSSLNLFLKARSHALSSLLATPRPSASVPSTSTSDARSVQSKIEKVLDCVLKTVEAVDTIFSSEKPLLPHLLRELEHPSSTAPSSSSDLKTTKLEPILTTLPNFPTLSRHLPNSILSYNPFLSSTSAGLSNDEISQSLTSWLESSTTALIAGVDEWITSLPTSENTALTLSSLRDSITSQLSSVPPSSASQAQVLQSELLELIESRLSQVYILKLSQLVSNLSPSLQSLLSKLSTKDHLAENDSSQFLFSIEMPHLHQPPIASKYSEQRHHPADPFGAFLNKVGKRVDGRTPLVDSGLEELEKSAREIRGDLKSWLSEEVNGAATGERELRKRYVNEVEKTLGSLVDVLEQILEGEEKNEEDCALITVFIHHSELTHLRLHSTGIRNALFVGTFARHLSLSPAFTRDLLLGVPPSPPTMLKTWQTRLGALQARSLQLWQEAAVRRAIETLRTGTDKSVATRDYSTQGSALPTGPSTYLLQSLNSLLHSLHALPLHRLHSNPSPATSLVEAFSKEALTVAVDFLELLRGMEDGEEIKRQLVWDVTLIGTIVGETEGREKWEVTTTKFHQLLSSPNAPGRQDFASSTTTYLLRTQSIYSPLFPSPSPLPLSTPVDPKLHRSTSRLLPLGPPPAASQGEFKSLVGVVQPGPRLNLLPTKV
ncbi:hypothetical protein JCM5353_007493, partial [Sporobolomyces roseus]